ncbi:protein of unknown function [Ralstonia solanacearum CMR15]|nr:protein of unknown function [Ralstonia solanacearum CMR15]
MKENYFYVLPLHLDAQSTGLFDEWVKMATKYAEECAVCLARMRVCYKPAIPTVAAIAKYDQ